MENLIVCPNCKKTITNNPIIEDAAKGVGSDAQSLLCDCGEKISYWKITALLRDQRTPIKIIQDWFRNLSKR